MGHDIIRIPRQERSYTLKTLARIAAIVFFQCTMQRKAFFSLVISPCGTISNQSHAYPFVTHPNPSSISPAQFELVVEAQADSKKRRRLQIGKTSFVDSFRCAFLFKLLLQTQLRTGVREKHSRKYEQCNTIIIHYQARRGTKAVVARYGMPGKNHWLFAMGFAVQTSCGLNGL